MAEPGAMGEYAPDPPIFVATTSSPPISDEADGPAPLPDPELEAYFKARVPPRYRQPTAARNDGVVLQGLLHGSLTPTVAPSPSNQLPQNGDTFQQLFRNVRASYPIPERILIALAEHHLARRESEHYFRLQLDEAFEAYARRFRTAKSKRIAQLSDSYHEEWQTIMKRREVARFALAKERKALHDLAWRYQSGELIE